MAYKVFSNGDALTGSELNTYLMNQSVMVFATTTARDAALTTPSEGMVVWLQDSDKYVYYTGSAWADLIAAAGSGNAIINGAFDIWQRGTSFSNPADGAFNADRWFIGKDGTGVRTLSQQAHTPGSSATVGSESAYFVRFDQTTAGTGGTFNMIAQNVEDVRTLAGQTVNLSFYAKAAASLTMPALSAIQVFGSGGSGAVNTTITSNVVVGTSWARYSYSFTMPSISGKTVGAGSYTQIRLSLPLNATFTFDLSNVQLESGSSATAFKRNASNIQGELAACQRYYWRQGGDSLYQNIVACNATDSTNAHAALRLPVTMRAPITSLEYSTLAVVDRTGNVYTVTSAVQSFASRDTAQVNFGVSGGGMTAWRPYFISTNNSLSGYFAVSAEL